VHIQQLSAAEARDGLPELVALLQDSVDSGASVGYLPPLSDTMAQEYWQGVIDSLSGAGRLLLTANAGTTLIGTVQLVLESRPNGRHRAEVSKLLVHTTARRHGVGTALMRAVEEAAQSHGRSLLVLDTVLGDDGQRLLWWLRSRIFELLYFYHSRSLYFGINGGTNTRIFREEN
jgi:GNAT superfamily N-acetyltransferase